jgi:RimJ/RimL family protein N-acetyltransferase
MPHLNEWGQPVGPALPGWTPPPAPSRTVLAGRSCRVEPLEPERHGAELFEAYASDTDARRWTYLPYGPFERFEAHTAWLRDFCTADDKSFFAVVSADTGKAAGIASYMRIMAASGSIEIGHLNFSARLQRTPAATEALYLMIKHALGLGYRRVEWKCDALNAPSRAAAERLGFSFEGIFRQATVSKGRSRDTAWFAIIDSAWPALERAFTTWLEPGNFDASGGQRTRLSELTALERRRASL